MPDAGTKVMDQLYADLKSAGYEVVPVGTRMRVTNPKGGAVTTLPSRLPRNAKFASLHPSLKAIGFDPEEAAAAREADRQKRLEADRVKGGALLAAAERHARANPAPSEVQAARRKTATKLEFKEAPVPVEEGPRTDFFDEFDAAFALELLKTNKWFDVDGGVEGDGGRTNRKFSQTISDRYAEEMYAGRWRRNHQGIGLDVNYNLVDGQHRLTALITAADRWAAEHPDRPALTIPLAVTYNLPPESGQTVDMGLRRQNHHVLGMEGEANASRLAAVARLVAFYDSGRPPSEFTQFNLSAPNVLQMVSADPELRVSARMATSTSTAGIVLPAALGAAHYLIRRVTDDSKLDTAADFFEALRKGTDLTQGSPILTLREMLTRQKIAGKPRRSLEHTAMTIKAWNAWVAGEDRALMRFGRNENVPRVTALK